MKESVIDQHSLRQRERDEVVEKDRSDSNHSFWLGLVVALAILFSAWAVLKGWVSWP
jgi:hypothetical protein